RTTQAYTLSLHDALPIWTWNGGREKAPAAICRKVAEVDDGETIEVWGDGTAVRSYTYVDDMVDGIRHLMDSNLDGPTNIGSPERSEEHTSELQSLAYIVC